MASFLMPKELPLSDYKILKVRAYGKDGFINIKVSASDYDYLTRWSWNLNHPNGYPRRSSRQDGKYKTIYLHRQLLGWHDKLPEIDHINGDRWDYRIENLRFCTHSENASNRMNTNNRTGYVGVTQRGNKWIARLKREGKRIWLGTHSTPEDAAEAIKQYKREHGEPIINDGKCMNMPKYNPNRTYKR